jgi:hypothetical protein
MNARGAAMNVQTTNPTQGSQRTEGARVEPQRQEGKFAKAIEKETSRLPSDMFLWVAVASAATSLGLHVAHKKEAGNFVAAWVPTLLVLGLYNKTVKLLGHDSQSRA